MAVISITPEYPPGVRTVEISGPRPIPAVGTACAGFVGFVPNVKPEAVGKPILITNWTQFVKNFARTKNDDSVEPHLDGYYLSHAVYGFFQNGGGRCYVAGFNEPSPTDVPAIPEPQYIPTKNSDAITALIIRAKTAPTADIVVSIAPPKQPRGQRNANSGEADRTIFTLKVRHRGAEDEIFEVTTGPEKPGYETITSVRTRSKLIDVELAEAANSLLPEAQVPKDGDYTIKATVTTSPSNITTRLIGSAESRQGVEGMQVWDEITMLCFPDLMALYEKKLTDEVGVKIMQTAMITHCELMRDRIAILDPLPDKSPSQMLTWRGTTNYDSMFAAMYYPWIKIGGPDGKPKSIPPSGHMAGLIARIDNMRGVHKAPANEVVMGAVELPGEITKSEHMLLNNKNVNCIISAPNRGIRVMGARTLSSDTAWLYLPVRRLFNFIEKSIEQGMQWIVFEPNDEDLWERVKRDANAFLTNVWRSGALFGRTPEEAFFVKCDHETNPDEVINAGHLVVKIGIAPVKPAEFVIFEISQVMESNTK